MLFKGVSRLCIKIPKMENTCPYFETNSWPTDFEVWTNEQRAGQRIVVEVPVHTLHGLWTARIYNGVHDMNGHPIQVFDVDNDPTPLHGPDIASVRFDKLGKRIWAALYEDGNRMWLYVVARKLGQNVYVGLWMVFDPPPAAHQRHLPQTLPRRGQ